MHLLQSRYVHAKQFGRKVSIACYKPGQLGRWSKGGRESL